MLTRTLPNDTPIMHWLRRPYTWRDSRPWPPATIRLQLAMRRHSSPDILKTSYCPTSSTWRPTAICTPAILPRTVNPKHRARFGVPHGTKFCGNENLIAAIGERVAQQGLIRRVAINFRSIKMPNPQVYGCVQQIEGRGAFHRGAVKFGQAHTAKSDGWKYGGGLSEFFLRCHVTCPCLSDCGFAA